MCIADAAFSPACPVCRPSKARAGAVTASERQGGGKRGRKSPKGSKAKQRGNQIRREQPRASALGCVCASIPFFFFSIRWGLIRARSSSLFSLSTRGPLLCLSGVGRCCCYMRARLLSSPLFLFCPVPVLSFVVRCWLGFFDKNFLPLPSPLLARPPVAAGCQRPTTTIQ